MKGENIPGRCVTFKHGFSRTRALTACAGDSRDVPLAVGPAAYGGGVPLDEARFTVIAEQGADLVTRLHGSKQASIFDHRGLPA